VTPWGYKSRWLPLCSTTSSCTIHRSLLTSFFTPEKKERKIRREWKKKEKWELQGYRERKEKRMKKGNYGDIGSVASLSFSSHGGARLYPF
jgi:hypothetical protein